MRTTIRLSDQLLQQAKSYAADTHRTLTALIEDVLRETLARRDRHLTIRRLVNLTTVAGAMQPGVDLDSNSALRDLMDEGNAASRR